MFDSLQDQLLEREMLKILKQLQGNQEENGDQDDLLPSKADGKENYVSNEIGQEGSFNLKSIQKEIVEKVSVAVGDEMIDWESNYINLMKECGYDLPYEENNDVNSDDEKEQKLKLKVKKNEEYHNRDFVQYKLEHHQVSEDDEEDQEYQKSKQQMDDLHNEEEQIMTAEQKKEYFRLLRSKYINTTQDQEKKELKSVDTTAYATNESETTSANANTTTQTLSDPQSIQQNPQSDNLQNDKQGDQLVQQQEEDNKPRNLLPSDHTTLTREMYDEWKKQQKVLKKAFKSAEELGLQYNGKVNLDNFDESSGDEEQETDQQNQEEQQEGEHEVIHEQDEDEYDENNDQTTQDEQVNALTEVKKEYLRTNKWNCKEFKIIYSNEDIFEGEVDDKTSLKDGWGVYLYANGEKYEGFFQDDVIHGYGRYWFLGGHKYEGDWSQGMKHGVGQLEFASGDKYIGFFEQDNFHGQGEYIYKNGDKFEGTFINGKKNGPGKFLGSNGRKIIGEWIEDQLQHF